MVGDYASWDYFQSIERPENQVFVKRFKEKYGADRVTSDVIEAAYNSVWLWAQAVSEAGTDECRRRDQGDAAPELECSGGNCDGRRGNATHMASRIRRTNPK